ncbi:hypothetical protein L7F22_066842 [Adiantum nelumboides]|nr:hypothetical protein [Adiantum nelumboides]
MWQRIPVTPRLERYQGVRHHSHLHRRQEAATVHLHPQLELCCRAQRLGQALLLHYRQNCSGRHPPFLGKARRSAQLDFIRSVQHELRTPLNGILGITDFLRQGLVSGETAPEKLDMGEDGLLASLLESIRLAGVNLSTILDDVLDFGAISGLRTESSMIVTRSEEVDLVREVEDVCLDELEYMAMHERQDRSLLHIYRGFYAVPTLVIKVVEVKVTPNTASNSHRADWTDQWADFVVQDTGIG